MTKFGNKADVRKYRYKLMTPYVIVFAALSLVGYQLINLSSAQSLDQGSVQLTTSKQQYAMNENIKFTLSNQTANTVTVLNNCPNEPLEVYRLESGQWTRLHQSTYASKCLKAPRSYEIAPNARVSATYRYWQELFSVPGQYRLTAPLDGYDSKPSVEFVVAP